MAFRSEKAKFKRRLSRSHVPRPDTPRRPYQTGPRPLYLDAGVAPSASEVTLAKLEGARIPEDAAGGSPNASSLTIDVKTPIDATPQPKELHVQYADPVPHHSEKGPSTEVHREPEISWFLIVVSLLCVTAAVGFTADSLVESMDGISKTIDKSWIALVLLPAVSSIAECSTAIGSSVENQLSMSINVAVGSSIQTAFFVFPLMVNVAWAMGKPLSLLVDPFDAIVLYISVQTMGHVVGDGKSNWLEGAILICLYVIIAVSLWFYPGALYLPFRLHSSELFIIEFS
ncbi:hypothetical protein V5O48_001036 [Marasmius crinis-equi]|uniref:Sodium/calcium exchanger membrane region domain-containing protein n=1 Tax=Marasmius crinis-equi TaxID=585013 RepID=A0ABR3FZX8_9AGAR